MIPERLDLLHCTLKSFHNAATQEISRNVQEARKGTAEVTANIGGVSQAAGDTGGAATQVFDAASELSKQSETQRAQVEKFQDVRAA